MKFSKRAPLVIAAVFALVAAACGDDEGPAGAVAKDRLTVVVTTNILGDVVENLVGDELNVVTVMPVGADPHDFQASAQEVAIMGDAAAMIVNGADFEEGLLDIIEVVEADGVPVFEVISAVETIEFGKGGHDDDHAEHDDDDHAEHDDDDHAEHDDDDHAEHDDDAHAEHDDDDHAEHDDDDHAEHDDDDHAEHDDHGEGHDHHEHDGVDPHFFTDPSRMAVAADAIANFLIAEIESVDSEALRSNADAYIGLLEALDIEVSETLASLSDSQRVLVTNHQVFGYFADRYDLKVVGTVIPSGSTVNGADARTLAALTETIKDEGVPAIFSDTSSSDELVQMLADEVGEIEVVKLFSESLGDKDSNGATYLEMVRTNAQRIAAALGD